MIHQVIIITHVPACFCVLCTRPKDGNEITVVPTRTAAFFAMASQAHAALFQCSTGCLPSSFSLEIPASFLRKG